MSVVSALRRAGSIRWGWLAAVVLLFGSAPRASAQARPDSASRDTVRVPVPPGTMATDTLPADSLLATGDTLRAVPPFPSFPDPRPVGFAFGRWEFDRTALQHYHGLTLLQLLERVPGLTIIRAGGDGAPAGISTMGDWGGRVRVLLDGYELDPLGSTTPELQELGLSDLESVRVERGPDGVTVDLRTVRLTERRPLSVVTVGTGVYDAKILRALFARTFGRRNVVTGGYDLASTSGFGFANPVSVRDARLTWSYAFAPTTALRLDLTTQSYDFGTASDVGAPPLQGQNARRSVVLRGRSQPLPGLTLDAMAGRSIFKPGEGDTLTENLSSGQAAVRAAYDFGRGWLEATGRLRQTDARTSAQPGQEISGRAMLRVAPRLVAEGQATFASVLGTTGTALSGTLRAGPLAGLSVFATVGAGSLPLPVARDTTWNTETVEITGTPALSVPEPGGGRIVLPYVTGLDSAIVTTGHVAPRFSAVSGGTDALRVGAEWSHGLAVLGAAAITRPATTLVPFGLAFDRGLPPRSVGAATGYEAYAWLPFSGRAGTVTLQGSYSGWSDTGGRPFLPEYDGRLAAILHGLYFDGQLEPTLRLEGRVRGSTLALLADSTTQELAPFGRFDLELEIRILDVQAFLVMDNVLNQRLAAEVPNYFLPGSTLFYGIRWTFHN
ncbi:MAG TPA: TonB-dependent receptor plug domain-containing protein [Longimicrobiaceae bacterium]|nr:TonB-dependent receptor plug domain-containing protein [Longimicrobiaceae bacterium]